MARIVMQPSGRAVECRSGDTVLMALENAGYALPNNFRAGACGECKVKVLSGQFDQGIVLDMALSADERRQGYGLMCMAKPISCSSRRPTPLRRRCSAASCRRRWRASTAGIQRALPER